MHILSYSKGTINFKFVCERENQYVHARPVLKLSRVAAIAYAMRIIYCTHDSVYTTSITIYLLPANIALFWKKVAEKLS